jgi:hypothetical protein
MFIFIMNIWMPYSYSSPFAGASLHLLNACKLNGKNLSVLPSRESNTGMPYSKPTRYQLRATLRTILNRAAPQESY